MNRIVKPVRIAATLSDVAREAGVSKNAVSVVLNGAKVSTRVSDATRQRILDAAGRLQYRPNASAQSLALGRTNTIGALFGSVQFRPNSIRDEYGANIFYGIVAACERYDFNVTVFTKPWFIFHTDVAVYRDQLTDGIVVIAPGTDSGLVEGLVAQGVRISAVSYLPPPEASVENSWDSTDTDNFLGARLATEYLIGLGHRRIAHLMGTPTLVSAPQRRDGYRAAFEAAGLPFVEELLVQGIPEARGAGSYSGEYAAEDTRRLLALPDPPTAIFAGNDVMAQEALRGAREAGVAVPERLSLIGFDDREFAASLSPPLTTVRQPLAAIGEKAGELLIARILAQGGNNEESAAVRSQGACLIAPELIVRGTTAPAPPVSYK